LPREILSEEEFFAVLERAEECRVKRLPDEVKLKLRTPRYLYTYKTDPSTAERLIAGLKIPVIDI